MPTQFTRLTVKSFLIEFKFHGPLEAWRQNSQGCFWTNGYFANCFSNRFIVLFSEDPKNLCFMSFGPALEKQRQAS